MIVIIGIVVIVATIVMRIRVLGREIGGRIREESFADGGYTIEEWRETWIILRRRVVVIVEIIFPFLEFVRQSNQIFFGKRRRHSRG